MKVLQHVISDQIDINAGQEHAHVVRESILVLDETQQLCKEVLEQGLSYASTELVAKSCLSEDLFETVQAISPESLVLVANALNESLIAQIDSIFTETALPITLVALNHDETLLSSAIQAGVSAYCIGEIEVEALGVQISQARIRFEECNSIKTELSQIKDKLEARKLISRAKGFIMKQKQISEDEAYGQLRSSAMNQGLTMEELSRRVISVFETVG